MIPHPIHKALLIFRSSNARFLLMGGQACILYGAAEFSRDLDLSIGMETKNLQFRDRAKESQIRWWLKECRTPSLLVELAQEHPSLCREVTDQRPLPACAANEDRATLESRLQEEENLEKEKDRAYWLPLRRELERWRRERAVCRSTRLVQ